MLEFTSKTAKEYFFLTAQFHPEMEDSSILFYNVRQLKPGQVDEYIDYTKSIGRGSFGTVYKGNACIVSFYTVQL